MASEPTKPKVSRARVKASEAAAPDRAETTPTPTTPPAAPKPTPAKPPTKPVTSRSVATGPVAVMAPAAGSASSIADAGSGVVRADHVEITQGGADRVEAASVSVMQGGIAQADARTIDIRQGGIGRASATDIAVSAGAIGFAKGERVSLEMGAIGAAVGGEVRVTQSMSGFVAARGAATVDQSLVSTLIADRVTIRQPSAVLVLIARQVDGTVRPLLDWRGALAAGAVAGMVLGLLRLGRR